ncbi:hypothetical protein DFH05DRAFT_1570299 [Lentinula detonsa]|uniref:Fungal-type protein kinase domain-containing protein n=1 Tax=Lentinula detonsa TaxID=2804962 RepID=A0A9W8U485_9AGAR|nr:hypothetical protein DFH05DRAFT_1570299 [Lentinula detonsa]KAJ3979233.1 hypothetical protein F5890DRAFT_1640738 [Lentinula detonsa]
MELRKNFKRHIPGHPQVTSNSDLEDPAQIIGTGSIIKPPSAYNPLHDMESIWWILVYLLYFNDDKQNMADADLADSTRAVKALKSFNQSEGQTLDRQQFLQNYDELTVEETRLPPSFQFVVDIARAKFAAKLHAGYRQFYQTCRGSNQTTEAYGMLSSSSDFFGSSLYFFSFASASSAA